MKKILGLFVLAMGCLMWTSCSSDDYTEKVNSVQVERAETTIAAAGGTATIQVTGTGIKATSAASWLSVAVNGNTIVATATANPMRESRATHVTVTASNGDEQLISVVQYGLVLSLSVGELDVNGSTQEYVIEAETTVPLTVTSDVEWITAVYDAENHVINVTIMHNVDENPREGHITVQGEGVTETITIKQGGIVLEVAKDKYVSSTNKASKLSIPVIRSIEVEVTSDADWLTATFNEETNKLEVSIAASTEVQRSGNITLTSGSLTKTVTIEQYELFGQYYLLYTDAETGKTYYYKSMLDDKGLYYDYMEGLTLTYPFVKTGDYELTVGPAGSPIGNYGTALYFFLAWGNHEGYWSTYNGTESATMNVVFEEGDQYIDELTGTFGESERVIDCWFMWGCSAPEFSSTYGRGYYDWLIYPYLYKVPENAGARRSATRAIRTRDGQEAMPAVLKNILRPCELKK
ncbi:BACON domain-containing protein [Prevotella sp. tf2-5]|uniref:BACON domain-containing protein n=1 Tax=Prevotella sp. tf2-5 TaxID=1761889 RepID=UPI0015A50BA1|nr:BACON domain-containing protein [Prevotella sp. tf2-5]